MMLLVVSFILLLMVTSKYYYTYQNSIFYETATTSFLLECFPAIRKIGSVCSASVINDYNASGRSLLATAAHCVYDEGEKNIFYEKFLFIPNQDDGGPDGSDNGCGNDPYGCW